MAIYRTVHISFWTDAKICDNFTPEDKYFMLYCLTNSHTNLIGCYEISIKQMSMELGYDDATIKKLLERFSKIHKTIDYDYNTKELFIKNWYKYNWTSSEKLIKPLFNELDNIKSKLFKKEIADLYNSRDTVSIPYTYPSDTTVTVYVSDTDTNIVNIIISYLNNKLNTNYKYNNKNTIKHIKARLSEGFKENDFKLVIDKKITEWKNTDMEKYLRPETLFGTKFENYLNQPAKKRTLKDISFEELEEMGNEYNRLHEDNESTNEQLS